MNGSLRVTRAQAAIFDGDAEGLFGTGKIQALVDHPRFDEAMLLAATSIISFYRGSWLLNRIANDRGRVIGAHMMLDLHFSGGRQGFTISQLREEARQSGLSSPNRMTALAALFRMGGFLALIPTEDSRQRKLAPTASLIALHRGRIDGLLAANLLLHPELAAGVPALADDGVSGGIVHGNLSVWRAGLRAIGSDPLLTALVDRDAAFTLLFLMMVGANRGESFRVSDLARQFSISRTHTLIILREAMRHGCLERVGEAGPYQGTLALMEVLRPFFARIFLVQHYSITRALGLS